MVWAAVLLLCGVMAVAGCPGSTAKGPPMGGAKEAVPVRVAPVTRQTVPVQAKTFGGVESMSTVAIKSQISGELTQVRFDEGGEVAEGQVLFIIDPRPYEVALAQAEANLAKAEAQVEQSRASKAKSKVVADNAQVELDRNKSLLPKKMVSQEEFDRSKTNAESARATLAVDEATIKSSEEAIRVAKTTIDDAKLRLAYCSIHAPVKGKTGSLYVHKGDLIKANDTTPMVTIAQTEPIYVTFTLPERQLSIIRERMAQGTLEVNAVIPQQEDKPVAGTLSFIDNTVSAGMIRLKGLFDNKDGRLWPGQFVNVVLQIALLPDAIVVPSQAVQVGQAGAYVYVAKADMSVEMRKVVAGETVDNMTIIKDGLQPEEQVVVDGQSRLTPKSTISIASDAPAPAEGKHE